MRGSASLELRHRLSATVAHERWAHPERLRGSALPERSSASHAFAAAQELVARLGGLRWPRGPRMDEEPSPGAVMGAGLWRRWRLRLRVGQQRASGRRRPHHHDRLAPFDVSQQHQLWRRMSATFRHCASCGGKVELARRRHRGSLCLRVVALDGVCPRCGAAWSRFVVRPRWGRAPRRHSRLRSGEPGRRSIFRGDGHVRLAMR
jgi:hypothetical protein